MFAEMRELRPEDDDIAILPVVPVSEVAVLGLVGYNKAYQRVYDSERYLGKLSSEQVNLYIAMEAMSEEWGLEGAEAELFELGFALTYTAIANQAELIDTSVDDINVAAYDALSARIESSDWGGYAYVKDSFEHLAQFNESLVHEWLLYLHTHNIPPEGDGTSFIMGGIMAHDLIREQLNQDEILTVYASSVN